MADTLNISPSPRALRMRSQIDSADWYYLRELIEI